MKTNNQTLTPNMAETIKIAVQSSGRLREPSLQFLNGLGLKFSQDNSRMLLIPCLNANVQLMLVRHNDIPFYVQNGIADFGIVGENILYETYSDVIPLKKLTFGQCSLIIAIPKNSTIQSKQDLQAERIATAYPNSLKKFLEQNNLEANIVEVSGSVEVTTQLGLADAICDITQTGQSLRENGLTVLEKIIDSQAILIKNSAINTTKEQYLLNFLGAANENILS